jgi:hypothetical protein
MDLREMENELFKIKTKHEITMPPMRKYIEDRLRKTLIKIFELDQQEMVAAITPPPTQNTYKRSTDKQVKARRISIIVSQATTLFLSLLSFFYNHLSCCLPFPSDM